MRSAATIGLGMVAFREIPDVGDMGTLDGDFCSPTLAASIIT
jgi:hypothetical protein